MMMTCWFHTHIHNLKFTNLFQLILVVFLGAFGMGLGRVSALSFSTLFIGVALMNLLITIVIQSILFEMYKEM
jgi:hypothetical protein